MEETSEELPNFSIGIDLLGPNPTSSKNKAKKLASYTFRICRKTSCSKFWTKDIQTFYSDTGSFSFDFLHFLRLF